VRVKFHGRSNIKHKNRLQSRVSGRGRPSRCPSGSGAVVFFYDIAKL
jgi:hypothetical protein